MNSINGRIVFLGMLAGVVLAMAGCGRKADAPVATLRPDGWLDYAVHCARRMPASDVWRREQGQALHAATLAAIKVGELDRAREIALSITEWQKGSACADVAGAMGRAGRKQEAEALLAQAEIWKAYIKAKHQDEGTMGWTISRIDAHVAAARAGMGDSSAVTALCEYGNEEGSIGTLSALVAADTNQDVTALCRHWTGLATNLDMTVQGGFGDGLLAWAEKRTDWKPAEGDALLARVRKTLSFQPLPLQIPLMCRMSEFLHRCGRTADATGELAHAEALIAGSLPPGRLRVDGWCRVAEAWAKWDRDAAMKRLDLAAAEAELIVKAADANTAALAVNSTNEPVRLRERATRLFIPSQVYGQALARVAETTAGLGLKERAGKSYEQALGKIAKLTNPGPRYRLATEICASAAGARMPFTPQARLELTRLLALPAVKP